MCTSEWPHDGGKMNLVWVLLIGVGIYLLAKASKIEREARRRIELGDQ